MARCSVFVATSMDGFIATEEDGLAWLEGFDNPTGTDYGYAEFMSEIDAIIMGRRTYEKVSGFPSWPYDKPVYVMSTTIPAGESSNSVRVVRGGPLDVIRLVEGLGHTRLYVDGGRTIQGFLDADLVDEMTITTVPIVLGGGIPLFGPDATALRFRLLDAARLGPFAQTRYVRVR